MVQEWVGSFNHSWSQTSNQASQYNCMFWMLAITSARMLGTITAPLAMVAYHAQQIRDCNRVGWSKESNAINGSEPLCLFLVSPSFHAGSLPAFFIRFYSIVSRWVWVSDEHIDRSPSLLSPPPTQLHGAFQFCSSPGSSTHKSQVIYIYLLCWTDLC